MVRRSRRAGHRPRVVPPMRRGCSGRQGRRNGGGGSPSRGSPRTDRSRRSSLVCCLRAPSSARQRVNHATERQMAGAAWERARSSGGQSAALIRPRPLVRVQARPPLATMRRRGCGAVAQPGERRLCTAEVRGSIPRGSTGDGRQRIQAHLDNRPRGVIQTPRPWTARIVRDADVLSHTTLQYQDQIHHIKGN